MAFDRGARVTAAAFLAFLAAAVLPRLGVILSGASYADDWGHPYTGHLASYRPVAALELWVMQSLFGPDYLTFKLPKFLSASWYALSMLVLMRFASRIGVPIVLSILIGVAALLHPIMNELVLWGVLSTLAFVTFLSVLGAAMTLHCRSSGWRFVGLILLCLGAAGSQIAATIGACFVVAELVHRGIRATLTEGPHAVTWRIAMVFGPSFVALTTLIYMRYGLGYVDFASRSIGLSSATLSDWAHDKFYVYSNAIANLYQAPLGVVLGHTAALRAFWPAVVVPPVLVFFALVANKLAVRKAFAYAAVAPAMLVVVLSPLLGANALPTGYRILGGPLLMLVVGASLPLSILWRHAVWRWLVIGVIAVVAAASLQADYLDMRVRKAAWSQDTAWLAEARARLKQRGLRQVALCAWRFDQHPDPSVAATGIVVSYGIAHALTYSVWYTQFLSAYLRVQGVDTPAPALGDPAPDCATNCATGEITRFGPFRAGASDRSGTTYVCD